MASTLSARVHLGVLKIGGLAIASAFVVCAFAYADNSLVPTDLIVQMTAPICKNSLAGESERGMIASQILSHSQGLVKLSFADAASAALAEESLLSSGRAITVAPNFLYHPEVIYQPRDITDVIAKHLSVKLAPFSGSASVENNLLFWQHQYDEITAAQHPSAGVIPSVNPPPLDVSYGVDPLLISDWALPQIKMPAAEEVDTINALAASPVIAAVIDTGVNYDHEDLSGAMWRKPGNEQEVGYDFVHQNALPFDVRHFDIVGCLKDPTCSLGLDNNSQYLTNPGHGTHCAGHIGAVAGNSLGIRGTGGNVQIMALKFVHDPGETNAGQGDDAAAIQSIDYAIANSAKIISISWGSRQTRSAGESSLLKQALVRAQVAGILVIAAAGNDSIDQDTDKNPVYPAAYSSELDNMIVVAASDSNDQLATFSNYGQSSVHIAAPGVKVFSTTATELPTDPLYNDVVVTYLAANGSTYEIDWNGTSMAAPLVAGAAALIWSKFPSDTYLQIKNRLLAAARPVTALNGKVSSNGVLDISDALGQ
jgi:subtilisin family serine protease